MRQAIERRKCNNCKKVKEQAEIMIGGSPFNGWLEVTRTDGSCCIPRRDNGPWDFCCDQCCIEFLKSGKADKED